MVKFEDMVEQKDNFTKEELELISNCKWCKGSGYDSYSETDCPDCEGSGLTGGRSANYLFNQHIDYLERKYREQKENS